jgi:hypothetical protein
MFGYDWKQVYYSAKTAERDLNGFKFQGNGWYVCKNNTFHVERNEESQMLTVYAWNTPNGKKMFDEEVARIQAQPVFNV